MLSDSDNFLPIRNLTDFQTHLDSDFFLFWKTQVHHSSQSAVSYTKVNKYARNSCLLLHKNTAPPSPAAPAHSMKGWGGTLTMDPVCALTAFYRAVAGHSIADDARKTDATLTPGGHRFGFGCLLSRHCNTRMGLPTLPSCYMVVSFLLLNVAVSCEPVNGSEATRQLLCRLAFKF